MFYLNQTKMKKTILKLGILSLSLIGAFFVNVSEVEADCTLTTAAGTDGRCFTKDGEYVCLERDEDTHCFVSDADPSKPVVGGWCYITGTACPCYFINDYSIKSF